MTLIRVLVFLFLGATLLFIFAPNWSLKYLSDIGRTFFDLPGPALNGVTHKLWYVLAIAFTSTLTFASVIAQMDFLRNMDYTRIIIFSKFISTTSFLLCFFLDEPYFIYIAGAVVDGLIFLISWYYYHAAKTSRSHI